MLGHLAAILLLAFITPSFAWLHLSFDHSNFLCYEYDGLCTTFLDEIGCNADNRTIIGCEPDLPNYVGTCKCTAPTYFDISGARISKLLIDNRMKWNMLYLLLPWTGPPYDVPSTYDKICRLTLDRLGCPAANISIDSINYHCTCGKFTLNSQRAAEQIVDKICEADLMERPVFANPLYLSLDLSIVMVVIVGKLGSLLAIALGLPPIIGFILAGMGVQDIINYGFLKGCGGSGPHPTPASEFKNFALIVVLMRAGITLKPKDMLRKGLMLSLLCTVPYMCEFAVQFGIAKMTYGWGVYDTGLMVTITSALGPSLIIPGMIKLVGEKLGYAPTQVLTSAPLEVVMAVILFNVFASLELTTTDTMYPWVTPLPLWANLVLIPVNIIFSCVLGFCMGYPIAMWYRFRSTTTNAKIQKIVAGSDSEFLLVLIVGCYLLYSLCQRQYIQQSSALLAVFTCSLTVSQFAPDTAYKMKDCLYGIWTFLEIFLFTLTGITLAFRSGNGPLSSERGINTTEAGQILVLLFLGQLGRGFGVLVAETIGFAYTKKHRQSWYYRILCWITIWTFQMPKATVQATLGGLPYAQHIIPGAIGLERGLQIQLFSAFTVLVFAPFGVLMTAFVGIPLAKVLKKLEQEAGFIEPDEIIFGIPVSSGPASSVMQESAIDVRAQLPELEMHVTLDDPDTPDTPPNDTNEMTGLTPRALSIDKQDNGSPKAKRSNSIM